MNTSLTRAATTAAVLTAALLALPLVAMQFTQEVNWGPGDFVAAGALLFGAGMSYHLATRRSRTPYQRFAVGALVLGVVGTVWAELAVGLFH